MPLDIEARDSLDREIQQVEAARYVESEEQFAGWNFVRSPDGRGFHYHELPVPDREVMVEDHLDWSRYMERGLTFAEQGRIMAEAAADPLPRMPEREPLLSTERLREIHKDIEEERFPGYRERMWSIPAVGELFAEPASRERFIRQSFDREAAKEFDEIAARPGDQAQSLVANYAIRAAGNKLANDDHPPDPPPGSPDTPSNNEQNASPAELQLEHAERGAFALADPLELARQRAKEAARDPERGNDGPEIG